MTTSEPEPTAMQPAAKRSRSRFYWLEIPLLVLLAGGAGWCWWVSAQIRYFANTDQAKQADAIVIFGAAEYDGKPSPVYRARLDRAHNLFDRGIAPLIITLGGSGGDGFTEGGVGQDYLMGAGVPESAIIAETHSHNTSESAARLAVIARANNLRRLVVVSDPMHMFRIHAICAADGLNVLTSPRAQVETEDASRPSDSMAHEILTYTLWRLHLD
jgi:uncharacterized SAM-binding protein YcdF (DUF218 family)